MMESGRVVNGRYGRLILMVNVDGKLGRKKDDRKAQKRMN